MKDTAIRVLIVDDMQLNRTVLASLLISHGIMSDQVESGKECLALCEEKDYDLILLDHRMPELDGVDTLVRLKELFARRGRDIPVICHTTEEGRKNINLYKAAGFTDVLIKPVDPRELFDILMQYLSEPEEEEEQADEEVHDLPSAYFEKTSKRAPTRSATERQRKKKPKSCRCG
ncbi:MAG: response regulator [Lachnospiraceae bacterium]|nr:response regulator [Lachnospiraceae bacterium]